MILAFGSLHALLQASMVVTEMIAYIMKWPSVLEPCFQFDFLD